MIRTLIVDDHEAIRQGLIAVLRSEPGIVPIGAVGTSQAAMDVAAAQHPRCVIVDRQLGPEDGLDLVNRLRALPDPPAVVLYSAFADEGLAAAATAAGAGATVSKGAPLAEVVDAVKQVGRRARPAQSD